MSNKIIALWGFLVVFLVCTVYVIGINYKNEIEYINIKTKIKESTKEYIKKEDKKLPLQVTSEELEEKGYIDALKLEEKTCAADISVKKTLVFYNFDIDFTCINEN